MVMLLAAVVITFPLVILVWTESISSKGRLPPTEPRRLTKKS